MHFSFVKERLLADKYIASAESAYELACEVYNVALETSYCKIPELTLAMQRVAAREADVKNVRRYADAVDQKILEIRAKFDQTRCRLLAAQVMEVLPPELRDIIYEGLCNTDPMRAEHLNSQPQLLERINMPMFSAEVTRLRRSPVRATSPVMASEFLCAWLDTAFAEQLIDYWYRKTNITISRSQDLDPEVFLHCDPWGSRILPALSITRLTLIPGHLDATDYVRTLNRLDQLKPGLRTGATIIVIIQQMPRYWSPYSSLDKEGSFEKLLALIHPPVETLIKRGYHIEVVNPQNECKVAVDMKNGEKGGLRVRWRDAAGG